MSTEVLPPSGAYDLTNFIYDPATTIIAKSSEADLFPAVDLLNPLRSKRWRTTSGGIETVDFDLGSAKLPTFFALISLNMDATHASDISFSGCDNTSFTDSPPGALHTYSAATTFLPGKRNAILRWYFNAPDPSPGYTAAAKRYWRVTLGANIQTGSFHALGGVWLGAHTAFKPQQGIRPQLDDPSKIVRSSGGAPYVDRRPWERGLDFEIAGLLHTEMYQHRDALEDHGTQHMIVDIHAYATDEAEVEQNSPYYGLLDARKLDTNINAQNDCRVSFGLMESRG